MPKAPRRRYGVFTGTNPPGDWWHMARALIPGARYDRPDVIAAYEHEFARRCGARHGVSFGAGRMALYAILEALDIGPGDEVVIPAYTCVVVPNAILYRGARPVYVDIEPERFNIDVTKVEAAITPRTKALYAQHTFGVVCDVDALCEIGARHALPVIEDAAHALGARHRGRPAGSLTEIAFFTTDHSKMINTHLGGIAVTNDDALAERLRRVQAAAPFLESRTVRRLIRTFLLEWVLFAPRVLWIGAVIHAVLNKLGALFFFSDELQTSKPTAYPYPCRLSSTQAELGLRQLAGLEANLAHRRAIAAQLDERFGWYGSTPSEIADGSWLRYSFLASERAAVTRVLERRFDLAIWFTSVVAGRDVDLPAVGYEPGSCPVAEHVAEHIVNLPTHRRVPRNGLERWMRAWWHEIEPVLTPKQCQMPASPVPR